MKKTYFNDNWEFTNEWFDNFPTSHNKFQKIRLPHTVKELSFNYAFSDNYQMICGYRKQFNFDPEWKDKRVFITFEGAAHFAEVFINNKKIGENDCGYTAFSFELTDYLDKTNINTLTIKLNCKENLNIPPFGNTIDYLTYGGIYRNVYISITEQTYIEDAYPMAIFKNGKWIVNNSIKINNYHNEDISFKLYDQKGTLVQEGKGKLNFEFSINNPKLWSIENPNLYQIEYILNNSSYIYKFGFRKAEFKPDGFYLNDEKIKIRGLNRHQSFPYFGYAMPDSLQAYDADILKYELGINLVRTSHYPQSQSFLNRCDEIGLLVFEEIPGWQYIGNEEWKDVALKNVERMIIQNRFHPSIVLWGVRINESPDNDDLYKKTNALAHQLDPSRQTGGVRCMAKSNLLEDVYTYNDFSFSGVEDSGLKTKSDIVKQENMTKGYLVSEYMGHMFPTKSFDSEEHRLEHALRHAKVLQSAYHQNDISGCIGWCMFDYNTHKEFGSEDRICYHGVMDMFRNPKLAASFYESQSDDHPVLEVSDSMEIGDHPSSTIRNVWCFSNAEKIKLYKNDLFVKEFYPSDLFKDLPHPPFKIDDLIGNLVSTHEKYTETVANEITDCLLAAQKYGLDKLPGEYKNKILKLEKVNNISIREFNRLYDTYASNWGAASVEWKFEAIKNNKVVKTVIKGPAKSIQIKAKVSTTLLNEEKSWDASLIRISVVDNNGNVCRYFNETLELLTKGEIEIIGPKYITLKGGVGGTFVKTNGNTGLGKLIIKNKTARSVTINFKSIKNKKPSLKNKNFDN